MQHSAIAFTLIAPLLLWISCRIFPAARFALQLRRALAIGLLIFELGNAAAMWFSPQVRFADALPMQLCDWVLLAVAAALWWKWQLGFELGYFWGIAGTAQALFTPAIAADVPRMRLFGFFFSHALIVVGVLHLLCVERMRPQRGALWRLFVCSEIYVLTALAVNALTGGNYGFLAHHPVQRSALDLFPDDHTLYVLAINLAGLLLIAALYLPWLAWDRWKKPPPAG